MQVAVPSNEDCPGLHRVQVAERGDENSPAIHVLQEIPFSEYSPASHAVHGSPTAPPKPRGQSPVVYQLGSVIMPVSENMDCMFVTELTSQLERSALKAEAMKNMLPISVTEPTFQLEMSALNADAWENMSLISVTELTTQPECPR